MKTSFDAGRRTGRRLAAPMTRIVSGCGWLLLLLCSGCALFSPRPEVIHGPERAAVATAFQELHRRQADCHCCIDAAVTVTIRGLLRSGTVAGYLQAMSPSFLRFVGVNPLGQPLLILVSDGHRFQYLAVPEAKEYSGDVRAETFVKYAPAGFRPGEAYFWLTGRLPDGELTVEEVAAGGEDPGYWLTVLGPAGAGQERHRLLFDPAAGLIRRHQVLDGRGGVEMDAVYEQQRAVGAVGCRLPSLIMVTTSRHQGTLRVAFSDWQDQVSLTENDFSFARPPGFEEVEVP